MPKAIFKTDKTDNSRQFYIVFPNKFVWYFSNKEAAEEVIAVLNSYVDNPEDSVIEREEAIRWHKMFINAIKSLRGFDAQEE